MDLCAFVNVAFCDGCLSEGGEWGLKLDVVEAVSVVRLVRWIYLKQQKVR